MSFEKPDLKLGSIKNRVKERRSCVIVIASANQWYQENDQKDI
jgi:hypothetical protein